MICLQKWKRGIVIMNVIKELIAIARAAVIAALYIVICGVFAPISFGPVQFRIAEALAVLPYFTSSAVPGLFIGCMLSNLLYGGLGVLDLVLGSLATLSAAYLTRRIKNKYLAMLPPVLINAVVIGFVLNKALGEPYIIAALQVLLGQAVVCYAIGVPLMFLLERYGMQLFGER